MSGIDDTVLELLQMLADEALMRVRSDLYAEWTPPDERWKKAQEAALVRLLGEIDRHRVERGPPT